MLIHSTFLSCLSPSPSQCGLATMLCEQHQDHLMDNWPMPGTDDDKKHAFFKQARRGRCTPLCDTNRSWTRRGCMLWQNNGNAGHTPANLLCK